MTKYLEVEIDVNHLYNELVGEILSDFGCNEFILSEEYFNEGLNTHSNHFVKVYLSDNADHHKLISQLREELIHQKNLLIDNKVSPESLGTWNLSIKTVDEEDWAESWKSFWHPERIGKNIIICPSWETVKKQSDDDIIIILDPGSAFGTGSHPTTRLCIRSIEKLLNENYNINSVLDVGTGSGILSIVAAKLGATEVTGNDIDSLAVEIANNNAAINNVARICTFSDTSIKKINAEFDLVIVNILAKTILSMADDIKRTVKRGGLLVLSGLISTKVEEIVSHFENTGFEKFELTSEEDWYAVILKRI